MQDENRFQSLKHVQELLKIRVGGVHTRVLRYHTFDCSRPSDAHVVSTLGA